MVKRRSSDRRRGRRSLPAVLLALTLIVALLTVGSGSPVAATDKFIIGDNVSFDDGSPAGGVKVDLFDAVSPTERGPYRTSTLTDGGGQYGFPVVDGCYIAVLIAPLGSSFSPSASQVYSPRHVCIQGTSNLDIDEVLYRSTAPPDPKLGIDIEKFVNGEDADTPPGPTVDAGSTVTFTYVVKNIGEAPLDGIMVTDNVVGPISCPQSTLAVGGSMDCTQTTMTAVAGSHTMESCVKGFNDGNQVDDCDPVYWTVPPPPGDPMIDIEKFVNGEDADTPPGPTVDAGSTVTFTYVVENTGDVPLDGIMVTDNVVGPISCPQSSLAVGGSMDCTQTTMTAEVGQHTMESCVKGFNDGRQVDDCDPVYWDVPPPPSTKITECTQRRKRGFVVLADKQFPEDGFVPPSSVKTMDGEELISYAAYGRNPKRGWGLEGGRFIVDKDDGLGAVIITDQRGSYKVHCDIKGSPIGFDLDGSGSVENLEGEFGFDIDADGTTETLTEWFAPTEGILIDTSVEIAEPGTLTGDHLFGDMGGQYSDGYAKLATLDIDGDGEISGAELADLALWVDVNSNATLDAGELSSLADRDIVAVSTSHTNMTSVATRADGTTIVTQDLWFTIAPAGVSSGPISLVLLSLLGLGLVGYSVVSSRRRRNRMDDDLTDLLNQQAGIQ